VNAMLALINPSKIDRQRPYGAQGLLLCLDTIKRTDQKITGIKTDGIDGASAAI